MFRHKKRISYKSVTTAQIDLFDEPATTQQNGQKENIEINNNVPLSEAYSNLMANRKVVINLFQNDIKLSKVFFKLVTFIISIIVQKILRSRRNTKLSQKLLKQGQIVDLGIGIKSIVLS